MGVSFETEQTGIRFDGISASAETSRKSTAIRDSTASVCTPRYSLDAKTINDREPPFLLGRQVKDIQLRYGGIGSDR